MRKLVSILIPAYNAERWIGDTLRSALNQTWDNIEIIVIDDGSTDRTAEIAKTFSGSAVKVVTQPNSGPCVARNHAYRMAQGDFIQWLDADDLLAPDKIERQLKRASAHGDDRALISGPCGTFYRDPSKAAFVKTSLWSDLAPKEFLIRKFTENVHIVIHCWLLSRQIADRAGQWDVRLQKTDADGEYSVRLVRESTAVLFEPSARCFYRKGISGSLSATRTFVDQEELLLKLLFQHLLAIEDSTETRDACVAWLELWSRGYYEISPRATEVVASVSRMLGRPPFAIRRSTKFAVAERMFGERIARASKARVSRARATFRRVLERIAPSRSNWSV